MFSKGKLSDHPGAQRAVEPGKNQNRKTLVFLSVCLLTALFFSCHPRTVVRDGVKMPYDEAAHLDFEQAEKFYAQGKKAEALATLDHLIMSYPDSDWRDDAESKIGDIHLLDGHYAEAEIHYRTIMEDYMFSPLKTRATFRLGICLYNMKKHTEAIRTLSPLITRLSNPVDRLELNHFLSSSHELMGDPPSALPYLVNMLRVYQNSKIGEGVQTPFAKIASETFIKQRIIEIVNQTKEQQTLRRWIAEFGNSFPAQTALFRLAQVQMQNEERNLAEANLEELLHRFPQDPLAEETRSLLKGLQSRTLVNGENIGIILPLSGPYAKFGEETLHGIELAVSLVNDTYPSSNLQFIIRDSQGNPQLASKMVEELVTQHQVIAIIGPLFASTSQAAAKTAENLGIPLITLSPSAGFPEYGHFIFRNALPHRDEVKTVVKYAAANIPAVPFKRFAILYPNNPYGISMRDLFWEEVRAIGGVITAAESYPPGETDFKTEVQKMVGLFYPEPRQKEYEELRRDAKAKGNKRYKEVRLPPVVDFDALFIPDHYTTATIIADYLPYFDVKNILILGDSNWNNPKLLSRSPRNVQGAVFTDGFFVSSSQSQVRVFSANFQSAFGYEPKRHSAYAFDTTEILTQLLQDPKVTNRETLRLALTNLKNYNGVTGLTSFNENGDVQKIPTLIKVEGNAFAEISQPR